MKLLLSLLSMTIIFSFSASGAEANPLFAPQLICNPRGEPMAFRIQGWLSGTPRLFRYGGAMQGEHFETTSSSRSSSKLVIHGRIIGGPSSPGGGSSREFTFTLFDIGREVSVHEATFEGVNSEFDETLGKRVERALPAKSLVCVEQE